MDIIEVHRFIEEASFQLRNTYTVQTIMCGVWRFLRGIQINVPVTCALCANTPCKTSECVLFCNDCNRAFAEMECSNALLDAIENVIRRSGEYHDVKEAFKKARSGVMRRRSYNIRHCLDPDEGLDEYLRRYEVEVTPQLAHLGPQINCAKCNILCRLGRDTVNVVCERCAR